MRIALELIPDHSPVHRSRMEYAFRLFCAVYGHDPILDTNVTSADCRITYCEKGRASHSEKILRLRNSYIARSPELPAPEPLLFQQHGATTFLFHAKGSVEEVDWLAEIFEWTSCAHEFNVKERDSVGRVPFKSTLFGRYAVDEREPYAAIAMWFLQREICKRVPQESLRAKSPEQSIKHFVVCTHDVDFVPYGYFSSLHRLTKNALISATKSPSCALQIISRAARFAVGRINPLDGIEQLAREEQEMGIGSSFNFIAAKAHRRDANYRIEDTAVLKLIAELEAFGRDTGLHGSYTSLDRLDGLAEQFQTLRRFGFHATGGRQHWLRFTIDRLISGIERAGALFDTSVGWQDRIGFRAGACFPYPPYNFVEERPARFLELPMIAMDQALSPSAEAATAEVSDLLVKSRHYGWGGVSVLWHPASFGGGQLSEGIGEAFYKLAGSRTQHQETWIASTELLRKVKDRFIAAGLFAKDWGSNLDPMETEVGSVDAESAEPIRSGTEAPVAP
ncbi:MAG: hypothetical protein JWO13_1772 [Acidobacteriales bacterium]|nr:hypothetical protein [Terriglobales bacterium]